VFRSHPQPELRGEGISRDQGGTFVEERSSYSSGRDHRRHGGPCLFANYPTSGLTPPKLIGINRQADFGDPYQFLEMCEEIEEKDLHYLAVLSKRKMAVSKLEVVIQPASDSRFDIAAADFLTEALLDRTRFNLREHLYDISDALGKGFSVMEIIWNTAGRRVGQSNDGNWWVPVNLLSRDPRWFMFDWISGQQILVFLDLFDRKLRPVFVDKCLPSIVEEKPACAEDR
jgi:phage gp29-like protein